MKEFDTWKDVHDYWLTLPPDNHFSGTQEEFEAFLKAEFDAWVETNHNLNPRFTVKSDRKTAESDAINRLTMHK